jgi:hypothetical protein
MHMHVFSRAREMGEKFHACPADRELYGRPRFVRPVNKKETIQKSDERASKYTIGLQAMELLLWTLLPLLFCSFDLLLCVLGASKTTACVVIICLCSGAYGSIYLKPVQ